MRFIKEGLLVFQLVLAGCHAAQVLPAKPVASTRLDWNTWHDGASLRRLVGKEVIVDGTWNNLYKLGPGISNGKDCQPIFIVTPSGDASFAAQERLEKQFAENSRVEAVGILEYYQGPPPPPTADPKRALRAMMPSHFYFDANKAQVVLLSTAIPAQ